MTISGSEPRVSASGAASRQGLTNTSGPQVSTSTGRRLHSEASKPGSRSERGAALREPSSSNVQAWYGHCSVSRLPQPATTSWPRWRQTFTCPRSSPCLSRSTTTGTSPSRHVKNMPGSATSVVVPTYCQLRLKMCSCSRRSIAGSEYHDAGSVSPSVSFPRRSGWASIAIPGFNLTGETAVGELPPERPRSRGCRRGRGHRRIGTANAP